MKKTSPSRINPHVEAVKLDSRDIKLLALLGENSREPYSSLAKKINLSRESIAYRTNRYLEKGIIQRTFAKVDLEKLGCQRFRVFFNLDENKPVEMKQFMEHLISHPSTLHVIEYSDRWDVEWKLVARDIQSFDRHVIELTNKFSKVILELERMQVIRSYLSRYVPEMLRKKEILKIPKKVKQEKVKIDEKDFQILKALNENAQASTYKIAEKIDLSADGVGLRIKKLVKAKYIERFTILANLSMLGYNWYTFVITLGAFDAKHEAKLKEFIRVHPNIIKCEKVFGNYDLLFYIVVKNQIEFHKTIQDLKAHFAEIFRKYDTWVVYNERFNNPLPSAVFEEWF